MRETRQMPRRHPAGPRRSPSASSGCAAIVAGVVVALASLAMFPFAWPITAVGSAIGIGLVVVGLVVSANASRRAAQEREGELPPEETSG